MVFLDKASQMPASKASSQKPIPHCSDSLQVALYTLNSDEAPLLQYLASARDVLGRPLYDPQFALRLARQRGCLRACITLFCDVGMYEVGPTSSHMFSLDIRMPACLNHLILHHQHAQGAPRNTSSSL